MYTKSANATITNSAETDSKNIRSNRVNVAPNFERIRIRLCGINIKIDRIRIYLTTHQVVATGLD